MQMIGLNMMEFKLGVILMSSNSDLQKQKIMEAAKKVITEQGYGKLTLRQVAAEAGISPGTLYYSSKSKNSILYDLVDHSSREADSLARDMKTKPWKPDEVFARQIDMLNNHVRNIDGNKLFFHLMYEALSGDEELTSKIQDKYESWLDSFEDIVIMYFGIPKSPMSRALAVVIDSMVDGLCWKQLLGLNTIEEPGVRHFFKLYYAGRFEELLRDIREGLILTGNPELDHKR